jgi:hypothetical protein
MNLDKALDWGLALGVLFLLAGSFVIPQFTAAVTAAADINDTATKALVITVFGVTFLIAMIQVVRQSYKSKR